MARHARHLTTVILLALLPYLPEWRRGVRHRRR
jgi:hypothetical protein